MKFELEIPANMEEIVSHALKSGIRPNCKLQIGPDYTDLKISWINRENKKKKGPKTQQKRKEGELTHPPTRSAPTKDKDGEGKTSPADTDVGKKAPTVLKRKKKSPSTRRRNHRRLMEYYQRRRETQDTSPGGNNSLSKHTTIENLSTAGLTVDQSPPPTTTQISTPPTPTLLPRVLAVPSPIKRIEENTEETAAAADDDIYNQSTLMDIEYTTQEEENTDTSILNKTTQIDSDSDTETNSDIAYDYTLQEEEYFAKSTDDTNRYHIYGYKDSEAYAAISGEKTYKIRDISITLIKLHYGDEAIQEIQNNTISQEDRHILQHLRENYDNIITAYYSETDTDYDTDNYPEIETDTDTEQEEILQHHPYKKEQKGKTKTDITIPKTNALPSDILIKKIQDDITANIPRTTYILIRPTEELCYTGYFYRNTEANPTFHSTRKETGRKYIQRRNYIDTQLNKIYIDVTNNTLHKTFFQSLIERSQAD